MTEFIQLYIFSAVRQLTTPCVKVVEISGQYKPLCMERTNYLSFLWQLCLTPVKKVATTVAVNPNTIVDTPVGTQESVAEGISTPHASLGGNHTNNLNPTSMSTAANQRSTNLPATGTSVRTVNLPPNRPSKRQSSKRSPVDATAATGSANLQRNPSISGRRHKFSHAMIK